MGGKEPQAAPKPPYTVSSESPQPAPSRNVPPGTQPYLLLILLLHGAEVLIPLFVHLQQLQGERDG